MSPIDVLLLDRQPPPLDRCPRCRADPFEPFLRGQVGRSPWPWWAQLLPLERWRRPHCAVICRRCKNIVGWESPAENTP
ncbi:MAG: hypothetical protein ACJ8GN_02030 [Longimicrobiaceae bacterium]